MKTHKQKVTLFHYGNRSKEQLLVSLTSATVITPGNGFNAGKWQKFKMSKEVKRVMTVLVPSCDVKEGLRSGVGGSFVFHSPYGDAPPGSEI